MRDGPVFAATAYSTDPFPVSGDPPVTVNQFAWLSALQPHPFAVRTANLSESPAAGADVDAGESVNVQPWPWLTVMVLPATVSVPERAGPLVADTFAVTVPLPLPLPPLVIVIHDAWLAAVHAQPASAVTVTVPVPPDDGTDSVCGAAENVQPWPWLTVIVCPATISVPERAGPLVPATLAVTVPLPLPLAPLAMVIHGTWLAAVQAQPASVVTVTLPLPPADATDSVCGATEKAQPWPWFTVMV